MGKQPAQQATEFVVPQPKRYSGGKVTRSATTQRAAALARVHASRSDWRPIGFIDDELPLEHCFDGMMLDEEDNGMLLRRGDHGGGLIWEDGRPLSAASDFSLPSCDGDNDDDDDPLSEDEELMQLCASSIASRP
ncbi:Aste57867_23341 [Aphanomyces stellatus]|uniref:Aste57867_23341 protein n=1 Tax=Aphanomyces stellatus TaxID=120398 RepID=A0A485LPB0_9STRA|nr:hypothetical protein As57867_023270 [Aphanomyces stellatus]VFT99986.1 Aste57867_23341 [Aphanomyces stellatus]